MNTDMDIDINTVTDTITCRLVEAQGRSWHYPERTCISNRHQPENYCQYRVKTAYSFSAIRHEDCRLFLKPVTSLSSNSMDTTAGRFPVITISTTGCCFRKTQRHRTRNGAMPLCLFWHSFLVSAGYLPNTVFLIIKIC